MGNAASSGITLAEVQQYDVNLEEFKGYLGKMLAVPMAQEGSACQAGWPAGEENKWFTKQYVTALLAEWKLSARVPEKVLANFLRYNATQHQWNSTNACSMLRRDEAEPFAFADGGNYGPGKWEGVTVNPDLGPMTMEMCQKMCEQNDPEPCMAFAAKDDVCHHMHIDTKSKRYQKAAVKWKPKNFISAYDT